MLSKSYASAWPPTWSARILFIVKKLVLVLFSLVIIVPLVIMVSTAFKPDGEIYDFPVRLIAQNPTLDNFRQLKDTFPLYIWNSVKLTLIMTVVQLFTATTAAYAFSKLKWKGRDILFLTYVASMMIPAQSVIIPQFLIVRSFGLYDTHLSLILTGAFSAFGTFLVKQYFITIPQSYSEAAYLDGASDLTIFSRIILPLSTPVLATQMIFSFRYFWNDFFTPLIFITSPNLKTLPLGMSDFVAETYVYLGPQMAATCISIIPVMIVFIAAQKYFVEGVAASGVKG